MHTKMLLMCLMLLMTMNGCIKLIFPLSVNPLYTKNDTILNPTLTGTWINCEIGDTTRFCISQNDDTSYVAVVTDLESGNSGKLELHLIQLDNHIFLDMFPKEPEGVNLIYAIHLLPFHSIFMIQKMNHDSILMSSFNLAWINDMIEKDSIDVGHEYIEEYEGIFFTAPTLDMQSFVLKHVDEAFSLTYNTMWKTDLLLYRRE